MSDWLSAIYSSPLTYVILVVVVGATILRVWWENR